MNYFLYFFDTFLSPTGSFPYVHYLWLTMGVMLLLLELMVPGLFFFISFAIGCCLAALSGWLQHPLITQFIIGLLGSGVSFFILSSSFAGKRKHTLRTNTQALINREAFVTKTIINMGVGEVLIGRELWPAISEAKVTLLPGTHVMVVKIVGNKVSVR